MQFVVVKQISFMLENHPGALHRAAAELARSGVNIHGISVLDKPDVGVVRLHTSDPLKAKTVLDLIGLKPTETDVIEIELPNQPGKLADVCRALTLAEVNVDYAYGSGSEAGAADEVYLEGDAVEGSEAGVGGDCGGVRESGRRRGADDDHEHDYESRARGLRETTKAVYGAATTGLVRVPMDSMSMVTTSPGLSQTGGLRAKPTPCGVPVRMTVPGRRVLSVLRNSMSAGTSKTMSSVFQSCMVSPLRRVRMRRALGFCS